LVVLVTVIGGGGGGGIGSGAGERRKGWRGTRRGIKGRAGLD